jgi:hypothetical protein
MHTAPAPLPPEPGAAGSACSELLADDWDGAELRSRADADGLDKLLRRLMWLTLAVVALLGLFLWTWLHTTSPITG